MRRIALAAWAVMSLVWLVLVASEARRTWPHVSMDLSAEDAGTRAALGRAVTRHVAVHAGGALVPPLVVLALGWALLRRRRQ